MNIDSFINNFHFNSVSLIEELSSIDGDALKMKMIKMDVARNSIIFNEGTYSKGIYILQKGIVKIYQNRRDGGKQIVYFYGPGELMGYRPLFSNGLHPVTAEALEDCAILFIPEKPFVDTVNRSFQLSKLIITNLSQEFTVWINTLSIFTQQSIKENAALALLILREKYKRDDNGSKKVIINISRKDFANYIGTTVETSVRALRCFKNDNIITTRGRSITILDKEKLAEIIWHK